SFLQVLVESGLAGIFLLMTSIAVAALRWLNSFLRLGIRGAFRDLCYLNLALVAPVLLHGVFESSMVVGTSLDAFFLAFGIGLIDRTMSLSAVSQPIERRRPAAALHPRVAFPGWPASIETSTRLSLAAPEQSASEANTGRMRGS